MAVKENPNLIFYSISARGKQTAFLDSGVIKE